MSKSVQTTVKTDLPATVRKAAISLGKSFEERGTVHVRRVDLVGRLLAADLSVRAIEAGVIAMIGYRPSGMSKSTIGRYAIVHNHVTREDVLPNVGTGDARELIVGAMYRLAGPTPTGMDTKPAERVATLANEIAKVKGSAQAVDVAKATLAAFNAGEVKSVTQAAPKQRPGAITAGGRGKATDVDADAGAESADATSTQTAKTPSASDIVANIPAAVLTAEVVDRIKSGAITGARLEAIAAAVESALIGADAMAEV